MVITNIQRFSLHDGPGIRTTVFLKGCNLKCPWCANPENIDFKKTPYFNKATNKQEFFGYEINTDELYNEIIKDKEFYKLNNGGVTFSGGEPLLQIKELEPLLERLKNEGINVCFETALMVSKELVEIALKYADEFIIDIKILEKNQCKNILNGNLDLYYDNLGLLSDTNKISIFRIPLNKEYTMKEDNVNEILKLLQVYKYNKVEIFKIHNLAESKYEAIGKETVEFLEIEDSLVIELYNKIKKIHANVEIIKI